MRQPGNGAVTTDWSRVKFVGNCKFSGGREGKGGSGGNHPIQAGASCASISGSSCLREKPLVILHVFAALRLLVFLGFSRRLFRDFLFAFNCIWSISAVSGVPFLSLDFNYIFLRRSCDPCSRARLTGGFAFLHFS